MFVDASAIVAILTEEPEADDLIDQLERTLEPITSAIAIFEATLGLCRKTRSSVEQSETDVTDFLTKSRITVVPISAVDSATALKAFKRYGKGQGHPAQLNLGDCFAYAVAKDHETSSLFKGDDFIHTDAKPA